MAPPIYSWGDQITVVPPIYSCELYHDHRTRPWCYVPREPPLRFLSQMFFSRGSFSNPRRGFFVPSTNLPHSNPASELRGRRAVPPNGPGHTPNHGCGGRVGSRPCSGGGGGAEEAACAHSSGGGGGGHGDGRAPGVGAAGVRDCLPVSQNKDAFATKVLSLWCVIDFL